jgi:hypothetical protein
MKFFELVNHLGNVLVTVSDRGYRPVQEDKQSIIILQM